MSASIALGVPPDRATPSRALVIKIDISGPHGRRTLTALVDSGAQENFIDQRIVIDMEIPRQTASMKASVINSYSIHTYGLVGCETYATDG